MRAVWRQGERELFTHKRSLEIQEAVLGENGLIAQLKKRVVERALAVELTHHLGPRELRHYGYVSVIVEIADLDALGELPLVNLLRRLCRSLPGEEGNPISATVRGAGELLESQTVREILEGVKIQDFL
jgi:hypothetical protein